MNDCYEDWVCSPAWSLQNDLPLCPMHNNPFIYGAYATKLMLQCGLQIAERARLNTSWDWYLYQCQVSPGLYNRKPGGDGGITSHDEIIGMAYVNAFASQNILDHLLRTDGSYCNIPSELEKNGPERFNVTRIPYLMPFLRRRAGYRVSLISQVIWSCSLLFDALTYKEGDAGGRLRFWIQFEDMEKLPICGLTIRLWKKKMNARQCTPAKMFALEPALDVFVRHAPQEW